MRDKSRVLICYNHTLWLSENARACSQLDPADLCGSTKSHASKGSEKEALRVPLLGSERWNYIKKQPSTASRAIFSFCRHKMAIWHWIHKKHVLNFSQNFFCEKIIKIDDFRVIFRKIIFWIFLQKSQKFLSSTWQGLSPCGYRMTQKMCKHVTCEVKISISSKNYM